jgi:hypothetical protein
LMVALLTNPLVIKACGVIFIFYTIFYIIARLIKYTLHN